LHFRDDLYGGSASFWLLRRGAPQGQKVVGVSFDSFRDVARAVRIFETIRALRSDIISTYQPRSGCDGEGHKDVFGAKVRQVRARDQRSLPESRCGRRQEDGAALDQGRQKVVEPGGGN
jgi:hypothetical protein